MNNVLFLNSLNHCAKHVLPWSLDLLLHNSIEKLLISEQYTSCVATNHNCVCEYVSIPYSRFFIFKQVSQRFSNTDVDTKLV